MCGRGLSEKEFEYEDQHLDRMAVMVIWLAVLVVLCTTLPLTLGIELSKLYGHEYMEGPRYKRSGENYLVLNSIWFCNVGWEPPSTFSISLTT